MKEAGDGELESRTVSSLNAEREHPPCLDLRQSTILVRLRPRAGSLQGMSAYCCVAEVVDRGRKTGSGTTDHPGGEGTRRV